MAGINSAASDDVHDLRVRQEAGAERIRAEVRIEPVILGGRSSAHGQRGQGGAGNSSGNHESLHKERGMRPPQCQRMIVITANILIDSRLQ